MNIADRHTRTPRVWRRARESERPTATDLRERKVGAADGWMDGGDGDSELERKGKARGRERERELERGPDSRGKDEDEPTYDDVWRTAAAD